MPSFGTGKPFLLQPGEPPKKVLNALVGRKFWAIESRGPGTIYWGVSSGLTATTGHALPWFGGSSFVIDDEGECTHDGELYVITDTVDTLIIVSEKA